MSRLDLAEDLETMVDYEHTTFDGWCDEDTGFFCPLGQVGRQRGIVTVQELMTAVGKNENIVMEKLSSFYAVRIEDIEDWVTEYDSGAEWGETPSPAAQYASQRVLLQ